MKLFFIVFCALFFGLFATSASAINLGLELTKGVAGEAGYSSATSETTLAETVGTVIKSALSLVGIIFIALMVYAGFLWMSARGETEPVEKAQTIVRNSIIGLVLAVGAYSITAFVVPKVLERTTGSGSPSSVGNGGPPEDVTVVGCCEHSNTLTPSTKIYTVIGNAEACSSFCAVGASPQNIGCNFELTPKNLCR